MLKFDQVLHAHLGSLKEAITGWSETVTKLEKAKEKAETGLQGKAEKADWKGENAGVTQAFVRKTAKEFGDALTEASSIRNILRDAETEFQAAKTELERLVAEAPGKGIRIDQDGVVSYLIHPDRRSKDYDGPKPEQADFEAMRSAIKAAITRADDADDVASRALRTLVGGDKNNFSGTNYDSLKTASKAQDAEDAHAAYELYKKGDEATPEEIDKLNALFKANQKDPYFAEKFALEVGPKGSMEYWADMGDPSDGSRLGVDHRDKLKELQTNWSMTLATATHSTSPEMEQWKADVIKAGTEPIQTRGTSPYGFQVMSNLLRVGDYDDKFLKDYGNGLVVAERKMTHDGALPPGRAWQQMGGQPSHLNWLGGDLGKDPMIGFMEGLGHNPKASTEFFNSDIDLTPENSKDNKKLDPFDYFSKDRQWPEELNDKGNMTKEPGYNALGHALESATTGHPYDAEAEGLKDVRTKENAEVMQKVLERYGSDPKYMHEQPGIDDSLGKMGAAYIDELNRSLETDSDTTMEEKTNSPSATTTTRASPASAPSSTPGCCSTAATPSTSWASSRRARADTPRCRRPRRCTRRASSTRSARSPEPRSTSGTSPTRGRRCASGRRRRESWTSPAWRRSTRTTRRTPRSTRRPSAGPPNGSSSVWARSRRAVSWP